MRFRKDRAVELAEYHRKLVKYKAMPLQMLNGTKILLYKMLVQSVEQRQKQLYNILVNGDLRHSYCSDGSLQPFKKVESKAVKDTTAENGT